MREPHRMTLVSAVAAFALLPVLGCSSGGGSSAAPPRVAPAALRGQTHAALAATYRVYGTPDRYSALGDPAATSGTAMTVSPQGDSISVNVSEPLDSGAAVNTTLELRLPQEGSADAPNLHYPVANSSLSYMAFGEWMQPLGASTTQGGFFAFGNATPGSAIPLTGTATFNGAFHAKAFVGSLIGVTTTTIDGGFTAMADFSARTLSVSTTNSVHPSYNLTGSLSYASGVNELRGSMSTFTAPGPGQGYSGGAVGHFYGPKAEEVGGAFRLTRANPQCLFGSCPWLQDTYMGSFGAKR